MYYNYIKYGYNNYHRNHSFSWKENPAKREKTSRQSFNDGFENSILDKLSLIKCSSIISIAAFGPGDPGSNPDWFSVSNSNQKLSFNTQIIQAYDRATPIFITLTVRSLVGGEKYPQKV